MNILARFDSPHKEYCIWRKNKLDISIKWPCQNKGFKKSTLIGKNIRILLENGYNKGHNNE